MINYSSTAGFGVTAAQDIEPLTLICEYVGEVKTAAMTAHSKNDSIFQLLAGETPEQSLDIIPEKFANIGRFFNGVTDKNPEDANLRTMRCQTPGGECRLLIYSSRKIEKGEQMLFDYNLGCKTHGLEPKYDTRGFE